MRSFLFRTVAFMIAGLIIPAIILLLPIDKKYQYTFVKNACSLKSSYIYHRTYEDSLPVDVAFMGSSHTMCGISDTIVQRVLTDQGKSARVANMGFCRLGRDMEYLIFKDLVTHKKPKVLVLEVRQEEAEMSHHDFGYMADMGDVLAPPMIVNQSYFTDLANAFTVRLNYVRDILSHKEYNLPYTAADLAEVHINTIADTAMLYGGARWRWDRYYSHPRAAWADDMMTRYPKSYVGKIMALAKEHNVKVIFLYIPNFGYPNHSPKEQKYYRQLSELVMMPDSFYDATKNWRDDEHFNTPAAMVLSDTIAHHVAKYLR
ncbi:MAG: hypothetical protein JWO03_2056 [Bacteroidetes bacterium]|nr:hypothetical protein [Bacteroidota bacterium]